MADEHGTGSANAGAGAGQTAGSVSGDAGNAGTTTVTSVDHVPENIRQQIFDTGYGKGVQAGESRTMQQYGDHISIANWVTGREQMPEGVFEAFLQLPPFAGKVHLTEQATDGATEDPRFGQMAQQMQNMRNEMTQQQQKVWVDGVNAKLNELAGGNAIKLAMMREKMFSNFTDGNTPNFGHDDLDKWSGEIDTVLTESGHSVKSNYVQGKMEAKDKGAEGSAGTPPSPGEPEDVGEFGVFDDAMSQHVQAELEASVED